MSNRGFTCYSNAVMQILLSLGLLRKLYVIRNINEKTFASIIKVLYLSTGSESPKQPLTVEMDKLLDEVRKKCPGYFISGEHDSKKFMM